jgi:hypothetical protein
MPWGHGEVGRWIPRQPWSRESPPLSWASSLGLEAPLETWILRRMQTDASLRVILTFTYWATSSGLDRCHKEGRWHRLGTRRLSHPLSARPNHIHPPMP